MRATFIGLNVAVVSLVIALFSSWQAQKLPRHFQALPDLQKDPQQTPTNKKPFTLDRGANHYNIEPTFDYELYGMVVTYHESASLLDISHTEWGDEINTKDICVIWGKNLFLPGLSKFSFSSGDWTCYVQTRDREAWGQFNLSNFSNNHLLPDNAEVAKRIRNAQVGDQIFMRGQLVNYSINGGPARHSSTTREDRGGTSCEVVYVTDFHILQRDNGLWIRVSRLTWATFLLGAAGFLACLLYSLKINAVTDNDIAL